MIAGKPAAACGGDNAVYVVAEDNWNSNWMVRVSGNAWGTWYFGGAITSVTPRIAALGNGSEAVVILDSANVVWSTTYTEGTANGWQPWTQVGGILQDVAPAAIGGKLYLAGKALERGFVVVAANRQPMDLDWKQRRGCGRAGGRAQCELYALHHRPESQFRAGGSAGDDHRHRLRRDAGQ